MKRFALLITLALMAVAVQAEPNINGVFTQHIAWTNRTATDIGLGAVMYRCDGTPGTTNSIYLKSGGALYPLLKNTTNSFEAAVWISSGGPINLEKGDSIELDVGGATNEFSYSIHPISK